MRAPQGLAAINQQPTGGLPASSDGAQAMAKYFDLAKKLSDGQLADVMAGKSMDVPQFVAMTEAMGRKQLRQAVEGAQAQQQAQQPSVKDQLLADYQRGRQAHMAPQVVAGLDQLPAENMASLGEGHAVGGIIAFNGENGSQVPTQEEIDEYIRNNPALQRSHAVTSPGKAIAEWWASKPSSQEIWETGKKARTGQIPGFVGNDLTPKGKLVEAGLVDPETPRRDVLAVAQKNLDKQNAPNVYDREDAELGAALAANQKANKDKTKDNAGGDGGGSPVGKDDYLLRGSKFEKRDSPYLGLQPDAIDYAGIKDRAFGEGLMKAAQGVLSKARLAEGVGAGLGALAESGALSRKELAGLKKDERDYKLTLAKAEEAFQQGEDKLAFDYLKQAQDHQYHMAHVAAIGGNNPLALVAAIKKDPTILDTLSQIAGAKSDPRTNQVLIGKHAEYMKSAQGLIKPMTFDQWLVANGYNLGGQQVASTGNQGYSAVYDASGKRIQ